MILFVCVHNAGRSVMAEAFARARGLDAMSAGSEPQDCPHPEVVEAMREVGIEVAEHRGRALTDQMVDAADRVVTLCAIDDEACPALGRRAIDHWALDDPRGRPMDAVRAIRDEIRARVEELGAS